MWKLKGPYIAAAWIVLGSLGARAARVEVARTNYHGWTGCWVLRSRSAEAVVAPEIGRVMSFRRLPDGENPFWENPELVGKSMIRNPWGASMGSFGGDKTWPAPQSAWNWPPPDMFDASGLHSERRGDGVRVTSPVSPTYGIRTVRQINLDSDRPRMTIVTTYEKTTGTGVEVGVWVITQVRSPEGAFLPIPAASRFPEGFAPNWPLPEPWAVRKATLIEMRRDPANPHKIGNDGGAVAWVGRDTVLTIALRAGDGGPRADGGCNAEIYTNPDPTPYVELETLGPLRRIGPGDALTATNVYTLSSRRLADPAAEAATALAETR
jgi:hypothetical protein